MSADPVDADPIVQHVDELRRVLKADAAVRGTLRRDPVDTQLDRQPAEVLTVADRYAALAASDELGDLRDLNLDDLYLIPPPEQS